MLNSRAKTEPPRRESGNPEKGQWNKNLLRLLELTKEMLALADEGDRDRIDFHCGIIYGILRDAAYRLRKMTQEECERHKETGTWD